MQKYENPEFDKELLHHFQKRVIKIKSKNYLSVIMDYCIGSIGLSVKAKQKGFINALKPIFEKWLDNERYFSLRLLNEILTQTSEEPIKR